MEQGWLLEELEQRFHIMLEELARQFDGSVTPVLRRLALVELLPESIQQQVREGKLAAQVAMKFRLVLATGRSLPACQRMAVIFVQQHCDTRASRGELYAAWRRLLASDPESGFSSMLIRFSNPSGSQKTKPTATGGELLRDLELESAIASKTRRTRIAGEAAAELDGPHGAKPSSSTSSGFKTNFTIGPKPSPREQEPYVEPVQSYIHDSGMTHAESQSTGDCAHVGSVPSRACAGGPRRKAWFRVDSELQKKAQIEKAEPHRQHILRLFSNCKGGLGRVHEELLARGCVTCSYAALTVFCRKHGIGLGAGGSVAGRYEFAPGEELQHDTSPHDDRFDWHEAQGADGIGGVVLLRDVVLPVLSLPFSALTAQALLTEALRYFSVAPWAG